jgi:hypothetical protein
MQEEYKLARNRREKARDSVASIERELSELNNPSWGLMEWGKYGLEAIERQRELRRAELERMLIDCRTEQGEAEKAFEAFKNPPKEKRLRYPGGDLFAVNFTTDRDLGDWIREQLDAGESKSELMRQGMLALRKYRESQA